MTTTHQVNESPQQILTFEFPPAPILRTGCRLIVELPRWAGMPAPEQMLKLGEAAQEKGAPLTEEEGLRILGLG